MTEKGLLKDACETKGSKNILHKKLFLPRRKIDTKKRFCFDVKYITRPKFILDKGNINCTKERVNYVLLQKILTRLILERENV